MGILKGVHGDTAYLIAVRYGTGKMICRCMIMEGSFGWELLLVIPYRR